MGHRLLSPLGPLKLYPLSLSTIQTHTRMYMHTSSFPLTISQTVQHEALLASCTQQVHLQPSKACARLTAQTDGFQSSSAYAPCLPELWKITVVLFFLFSFFPSYLCKEHFEKHTENNSFLAKIGFFFLIFFICYWFRNAFALNTSMNFFCDRLSHLEGPFRGGWLACQMPAPNAIFPRF